MFASILRFELAFHARQPFVYVVSAVLFLLSFGATVSDNISIGGVVSNININSPYNVVLVLSSISFLIALIASVVYAASPVLRDHDHRVAELFLTTRVSKFDYLFGRFCGAMVYCLLIYFAALFGVFVGEFMPWIDPERLGPLRLDAYWFATWTIAIPNILMVGTLAFLVASLTRSRISSFAVLVLLVAINAVVASLVDPQRIQTLALLDPFGQVALAEQTRYWTPFEMNEQLVQLNGTLLWNRLIALLIVLLCSVAVFRFFPFSLDFATPFDKWRALFKRLRPLRSVLDFPFLNLGGSEPDVTMGTQPADVDATFNLDMAGSKPASRLTKSAVQRHDMRGQVAQFVSLFRIEFYNIVIGKAFLVMMMLGVLQLVLNAIFSLSSIFGTEVYPTTSAMLLLINGGFTIPLVVVLIFYSSELLGRERQMGVAEMLDAMPQPNWVVIAAKLLGLMAILAIMLLGVMTAAIVVQLFKGYYDLNLTQYLFGLFSFFQIPIWFTCVLAVFTQVVTGNRYLGMFVVVLYFIGSLVLPQLGFNHNLYLFSTPAVPYSIFTGFGPNLSAFLWFSLYWGLFCLLLLVAIQLLWQRGTENSGRFRWRVIEPRLTRPLLVSASCLLIAFLGTCRWIYYNTNELNRQQSGLDVEENLANYEKAYKQYEDLPFPDIVDLYAEVDIYPERQETEVAGRYRLQNNFDEPIEQLHFTVAPGLDLVSLEVPAASLSHADADLGYYIYELQQAMAPGEAFDVTFEVDWLTPGFVNNAPNTRLLSSGTFFNNTEVFPLPGYAKGAELLDNNRRRRFDLPPAERAAAIDDERYWDQGFGTIRTRANYEAIVSTSLDQMAVTPGYLEREWEENGRRYFHYKMDQPIWPFVSYLSADYERKADTWNDVDIEVYYKHGYNVDRMIEASKKSLQYFSDNFSPYQYRQYRIFEFPIQRGVFAQSFPNTIPFSEAIGFVADIRDPKDIDYVFYVTAHELAHQWWAHQVIGANVQGSAVLTETLSQYSALMVMEQEYGPAHMQRFLKYELDNYLNNRGSEVLEEMPLYLVESQGYIHYRKGSLVLYALKDYLGEETVNRVLRDFIAEWGFQGPPYPTTRDLIASFRAAAGPEYQTVITDLFEKIVIFDLRAEDSHYIELEDGRYQVTINTAASKFEADGEGEETEVDMDALIDIAVLGEEDEETGVPAVLHIAKQRVDQSQQTFVVEVDQEPVSVGIDPFNKLIDRNPDDNVQPVELEAP